MSKALRPASPAAFVINGLLALLSVLTPPAAEGATQVSVDKDSYVLISSVRYGRFEFDYTYTAQAVNSGTTAAAMCTATLSSSSPHSVVLDGSLSFGAVPAGGRTTSNDTFTFRQDRQFAFDPNALTWQVQCVSVPTNTPPLANAGADQTTFGGTVTLNGSASTDADGDPLTFAWTLTVRPAGSTATLTNPTSVMPTFVADRDGEYRAQLVVNDGHANSAADVVIVTTIPQNTPPVANAGPDQTAFVADLVTLDGTASSDIDGDPLTFAWVFLARPAGSVAALAGAGTARPTFTPDVAGDYTIRLTVNDGRGGSNADSVLVTTQVRNRAPTANAGLDQVVVAGQTVHLDGTASSDPEGTPLTFAWTFASRPTGSTAVLSNATTATPTFVADRAGNFVVQLIVSDGQLFSVPDTVLISTSNTPPVANAGPDQTVDPGTLVQLDGFASSDANNDPLAFLWSFTTRPAGSTATLSTAVIPNPTFVADRAGLYTVQLVVNDGKVDSAPDTVNITGRNRNPDAVDDSASTQTNVAATIPVLANDTDADGDTLTVTAVTQPANGTVVNNGASVTFTPAAGFSGTTTFTYTISDGHGGSDTATVTVTVTALPVVTIVATDPNAAEAGLNTGVFTVSRTGATTAALTVSYTVAGTATNGTDYQTVASSVVIPAGQSAATVAITPIDDPNTEPTETVVLTLVAQAAYAVGGANAATVSIVDNDLPVVTVTASDASASEVGPDNGAFTISRSGDLSAALAVSVTLGGTAGNGVDYSTISSPVTIPASQASVTVTLATLRNNLVEGSETAILALSPNATVYTIGAQSSATVTIADSPAVVTVTATDANASETGPDNGVFTLTRSGGDTTASLPVSFTLTGTAANGTDYTSIAAPVTLAANQTSATVTLTPIADALVEGSETAILTISASTAYSVGASAAATVTIADGALPVVTINATDANAAEAGLDPGTFTVSRTGPTTNPLTVNFTIGGSAANSADYQTIAASATISSGASTALVTITPIDDAVSEGGETVVLTLLADPNYSVGGANNATVTIADNDVALVTVTATDASAAEAGADTGTFTFTRSGSTTLSLDNVTFNILGTAQNALDYTSPSLPSAASGTVSFPAGQASVTVTVTPSADQLIEGSETVILALVDGANYDLGTPNTATVTIADNNQRPVANAGPDQTVFVIDTIQLNGSGSSDPESQPLTYQWSVASAPPTSAVNFTSPTIVSPTVTVSLPGTYVFQLIVNDANQDSLPDTVSITVNPVPTLSINDVTVTEGNAGTTNAVFTVSISTAINRTVTASFATANVSAVAPSDYQSGTATVTFAPNSTTAQSITVLVNGDTANEPNETFNVNLSGPANATFAKATGIGTIQNDDAAVTIALSPTVVNLLTSDAALMTVTLNSPAPAGGQIVALASNNTASVTVPANVTVLANQTTTTFQATATNTAGSAIITGSATGLASGTATVNVANRGITVTLTNTLVGVGRTVGGTVTLSQPAPTGGVTINLVSGNTNFATVAPASVSIAQGATVASFTVSGVAVGSTGITASATGFAPNTATITVTNNLISIGAIPNVAPGQSLAFPVSLTQPAPAGGVAINFTSNTPGVATVTASVNVAAGQQTPAANPQITGVNIGTAVISATATGFAPDSRNATVTVTLALTPTTLTVTQGSTANATLTASAPAPATGLTINFSSSNTANFTVPAAATIPPGQLSVLVPVTGVAVATGQILTASAPGIAPATSTVNITAAPLINFGNFTVGANLQETASGSLAQPAPPVTGVLVTVTSADPTRLLLSTDPLVLGGASLQLAVAGNSASIPGFFLQALAGTGTVDITLSAPGYATRTSTITLQPSGFVELNQTTINTTTFSANTTLTVRPARLTPGTLNFAAAQSLRPAGLGLTLPVQVAVTSSDTNTGVITTSPVAFAANVASVTSAFDPLNAGTSTISIVPPAGFATPANFRQIAATVTAPNISGTVAIRVGANLEALLNPALSQAPPSPVNLTITSANTAVAVISNSAIALGGATVVFPNVANTATQPLFIQATGAPGTSTTLTLSATGFNTATVSVDIDPSGFVELNQSTINTTTFSANTTLTIRPARLTAGTLNFSAQQPVRPAGLGLVLPVQVAVTSSDTNTGVITASPVSFGANVDTVTTAFDPLNAGTSTINVVPPAGFSTPAAFRQIAATVTAPNFGGTTTLRLGEDLQDQASVSLSVTPPAPVTITVTSGNTAVAVVGTNATVLGGATVTFAGVANAAAQTYFVQATGTAGQTTNLTITAPGYNTQTIPVTIDPSGFVELNQATISTTTFSANFPLIVRPVRLAAGSLAFASQQSLRPAGLGLTLPLAVSVTSSNTNTGIITTSPLAFGANVATLNTAFDPLAAGTTTISIVPPAGFDTPANFRQIPTTVTAPNINTQATVRVGEDLQQSATASLAVAPPNPVDMTLTVASTAVAVISSSATVLGNGALTFPAVANVSAQAFFVQAVGTAGQSTTVTISAPGYNSATMTVTVDPSGFVNITQGAAFTTTANAANSTLTVTPARLDPVSRNFAAQEPLRPAGLGLTLPIAVTVTSSNTAAGVITVSPLNFNTNVNNVLTAFDPLAQGTSTVTYQTPAGFDTPNTLRQTVVTVNP